MLNSPHKAIQKVLLANLPGAKVENFFSQINRVADIAYFPKKLIFEVQYSPISLQEVQKRNRDYGSLGFTVIWILHDRNFNKKFLPPAELYLRKNFSYYTSITPFGHGFFYDQLEFFQGNQRVFKGNPLIIKNFLPQAATKIPYLFPKPLKNKLKKTSLYLPGDLTDSLLHTKKLKPIKMLENTYCPPPSLKKWLIRAFEYLLKISAGPRHSSFSHTPLEKENITKPQNKALN